MTRGLAPKLIIHGGAGFLEGNLAVTDAASGALIHGHTRERVRAFHDALVGIVQETFGVLAASDAWSAVLHGVRMLEDNPLFNAGTGAKLQRDGLARMSAGLMDGPSARFCGVVNIEAVRHPIDVAARLFEESHTILAAEKATEFARGHGFPVYDPVTAERRREYERKVLGKAGTVGVVALDRNGRIVAGTSTGGIGGEIPGRVSDTATVAGNYASEFAGVSCTGVGEHIVNQASAARVAIRVSDGMPLAEAIEKTMDEASRHRWLVGMICADRDGNLAYGQSRGINVLFAMHDGARIRTFLDEGGLADGIEPGHEHARKS